MRQPGIAHLRVIVPVQQETVGLQNESVRRPRSRPGDEEHQVGHARVERRLHDAPELEVVDPDHVLLEERVQVGGVQAIGRAVVVAVHAVNVAVVVGVHAQEDEAPRVLLAHDGEVVDVELGVLLPESAEHRSHRGGPRPRRGPIERLAPLPARRQAESVAS